MPCLLAILAVAFPRIVFAVLWLFTNFFRSIESMIVLILGFLFLPLTTIVYAWFSNTGHPVDAVFLVVIIIAALFDLGLIGHGEWRRRGRYSY
jgi:hypothetical protein